MASPSQFFDPLSSTNPNNPNISSVSQHNEEFINGTDIRILRPRLSHELFHEGVGTIAYSSAATSFLRFGVTSRGPENSKLQLTIRPGKVSLKVTDSKNEERPISFQWLKTPSAGLLTAGTRTTYWLSIDSDVGIVRYGKHLANKAMTLYQAELKSSKGRRHDDPQWKKPETYSWLAEAKEVWVAEDDEDSHLQPVVGPLPVKMNFPPFAITADETTLLELEWGTYAVPANLSGECQLLHEHVALPQIVLNSADFLDFSKAIERSCATRGLWAYDTLKAKGEANATNEDPKCSYLRFTLGYNRVS